MIFDGLGSLQGAGDRADALSALASKWFLTGIRYGIFALAAGLIVAGPLRQRVRHPLPIAGLLLTAAAGAALAGLGPSAAPTLPTAVAAALAALAAGGLVADFTRLPLLVLPVLAAPGAWLLATYGEVGEASWHPAAVLSVVVIGGGLAGRFDARYRDRCLAPLLFAEASVGVYLAVPDTEGALVLLGVSLVVTLLAWPLQLASLGHGGAFAAVGLLGWIAFVAGEPRTSSIIGSCACLGLLVAEPIAGLVRRRSGALLDAFGTGRWAAVPVAVLQAAVVIFQSRVAGRQASASAAAVLALAGLLAAVAVCAGLRPRGRSTQAADG